MLEPVLAYYLNQYLGKYVTGLDADSLRISVWKGDVVLKDLKLRPEALEALRLPITVRHGILRTLRLKVCSGRARWLTKIVSRLSRQGHT
jgi:vacuolar protein sorting-associated protein 13A/C